MRIFVLFVLVLLGGLFDAPAALARKGAPLVLYPACPCYHAVGEGNGETRIEARLNLEAARRVGLRLTAELTDAGGMQLQTSTTDASKGDTAALNLRVPIQAPGNFVVTARVLDRAGKEIAKAATD